VTEQDDSAQLEQAEPADDEATSTPDGIEQSRRFRAATKDELDPQSFMVSDHRSALRAVFRGGSIAKDRGDATFIGQAISHLAQALRQGAERYRMGTPMVSNPQLRSVVFGQSVTVELEISPEEQVQMSIDGQRHAPTIDAARALGGLLGAEPEDLVPRALDLGSDAMVPYRRLLELLASDEATLEWQAPDTPRVVVLTSADANHDYAILKREGEKQTQRVMVSGKLSMADSDLSKFALTLPGELARPPLLKRKHRIYGTYPEDVGVRLKDEGLWNSDVTATIEVTFDIPDTTATPRDQTYVLVDAKPLPKAPPPADPAG
jgi:hypothetical protein